MHCCCYEHGMFSSLPSLKVWRPASSLPNRHLQIAHRVKAASRASLIDGPAFDRPTNESQTKQQTSLEGPHAASRRHLLFGAASVFGSTGLLLGPFSELSGNRAESYTRYCTGLPAPPEAEATQVLNVDGQADLEVFQFCVYLSVVALRGSVPNQWVEDFNQVKYVLHNLVPGDMAQSKIQACHMKALGEYGVLKLQQKGQLQDIYKELGQPV